MIESIVRNPVQFSGQEDVIVLPLFEWTGDLKGPARKLDVLCRSGLSGYVRKVGFSPKAGETALVGFNFPKAPSHVLLVGLGDRESTTPGRMAEAGGSASKAVRARRFRTCHVLVDALLELESHEDCFNAFLKGFLLAQYAFSLKSTRDEAPVTRKLVILSDDPRMTARSLKRSRVVAGYTCYSRDLVNRPGGDMTPARMAEEAKTLAARHGFDCRVMGPREVEKLGMGAVLGVARGSSQEPRFITIHYNKGGASRFGHTKVCLVGKGVTFDSGGLSIKPWQNMNEMKGDMAGGASVMAAMGAASRLRLPVEVIGLIPCVENMPDGTALRPGDVVTTCSGKTIEVISTDAEGRLILADALAYSQHFAPDVTLDIATLTGSVSIALGTRIAGVLGNDQEIIDRLTAAGDAVGEPVWQLPIDESFKEMVRGDISDYKNFAGKDGATITAAVLLGEFVGKTPWAHLDIAGTFWVQDAKVPYQIKGATGYGVDLTVRFLEGFASKTGRKTGAR